ncbi:MAG: hypothetical protein V2J25_15975 [Desulfatiglans sp.]|nr:hypothetical protein [Thermodesulfobacteriota bacterium]MEE4354360.1 hypothetical protein [Desulfatiglans sp.]
MTFKKKVLLWAGLAAALYFLLSYHYIYHGRSFKMLKKSELTLNYTFYSLQGKTNEMILGVDELREDGIADLLVELGRMTKEQKNALLSKYEEEDY